MDDAKGKCVVFGHTPFRAVKRGTDNIGSDTEVTITELAEQIKQLTESNSRIVYVPYDKAYEEGFEDMPRRVPDITKINSFVGFTPEMTLDGILKSIISFHSGVQR